MAGKSLKKNYFYNLSYQIVQVIAPFITAPYVSRILTAEGIGVQSFTHSIVNYFLLFGALSIGLYGQREIAYNQNNKEKQAKLFWELTLIKTATISLSLCVYTAVVHRFSFYHSLFAIYSIEIIACLFDVSWFFQGTENFKIITIRNIIFKSITIFFVFIIIKKQSDLYKYILLICVGSLTSNISIMPVLLRQLVRIKIRTLNCIRHIKPIIMLFIPQIAIQIYTALDKSMIGIITKSPYENGCYEQAMKIVKLMLVVITSLGIVVVPRMAHLNATGQIEEIKARLTRSFEFVFLLGLPMLVGLIGISDIFVPVFFGQGYDKSVMLIRILSVIVIAIGLNNVIGIQYLIPLKKEHIFSMTVFCGALVNFILNLILIRRYQSAGAAIASVAAESIITIIQFIYIKNIFSVKDIFLRSWRNIAASMIMFAVLCCLKSIMHANIANLLFLILISGIVYFLLLLILRDKFVFSIIHSYHCCPVDLETKGGIGQNKAISG
jgi:O-antigen/teichoic acid export membrane protein